MNYIPSLKEYRNKDMKRTLEAEIASKMGKTGWGGSRIWVWDFGGMPCAKVIGNSRSESQKFSSPRLVSKFPKILVMKIPPIGYIPCVRVESDVKRHQK